MMCTTRRGFPDLARGRTRLLVLLLLSALARPTFGQPAQGAAAPGSEATGADQPVPAPETAPAAAQLAPSDPPPLGDEPIAGSSPPPASTLPPASQAPPAEAVAAAPAPAVSEPKRPYSLGVTLGVSAQSETNSTSVVQSPLLEGAYAVHPRILVSLALGFGWLVDNQGPGESTFRAGNPQLSGRYQAGFGPWHFRAGLGVTAPLAHVDLSPDGRLYQHIYNQTLAMWGMWNQWLWLTDRMAIPLMFRASYILPGGQVIAIEAAEAMIIGVRGSAQTPYFIKTTVHEGNREVHFGPDMLSQVAVEGQIPVGSRFIVCPRLQTVLLPKASIDRWQSAASLRGIFLTGAGRFFVGVLVNLDEPIAAQGGIERWGFHLGKEIDL
jgi:hypothetical protein